MKALNLNRLNSTFFVCLISGCGVNTTIWHASSLEESLVIVTAPSGAPSPSPAAPSAPTTLAVAANGPFAANLSWHASTGALVATGYKVERCKGAGCLDFVAVGTATAVSFIDTGLSSATPYSYRVRATGAGASVSDPSNVSSATTAVATSPPPVTLPNWVNNLVNGQWTEISGTAISSVDPATRPLGNVGPAGKVIAWTSFVVDTRTSKTYSVAGGGHADYAGNEVDVLDLETNTPKWTQLLAPTPNDKIVECKPYYADDRPSSRHQYYGVMFNEFEDRIMLVGQLNYCPPMGGFTTQISSYNIGVNTYSPPATHPDMNSVLAGVAATALDPVTGNVYVAFNFNIGRWTRSTNTFAVLNPSGSPAAGNGAASAFDTSRGVIFFLGGAGASHIYSPANNSWTKVTLTGPNATEALAIDGAAMTYIAAIDSYLIRTAAAGGTVYQVNAANFQATTFATSNGATIPVTINGPYNKFLYVPRLRGCVYVPTYEGNAWFLRVH